MSRRATHRIHGLAFDFAFDGAGIDSLALRDWVQADLLPVLAQALEQHDRPGRTRRIGRLEIDLGSLAQADWQEEAARRLAARMAAALQELPSREPEAPASSDRASAPGEQLLHFLRSGRLDWTMAGDSRGAHRTLLRELLAARNAADVLRCAIDEPQALHRLTRQFGGSDLQAVARRLFEAWPQAEREAVLAWAAEADLDALWRWLLPQHRCEPSDLQTLRLAWDAAQFRASAAGPVQAVVPAPANDHDMQLASIREPERIPAQEHAGLAGARSSRGRAQANEQSMQVVLPYAGQGHAAGNPGRKIPNALASIPEHANLQARTKTAPVTAPGSGSPVLPASAAEPTSGQAPVWFADAGEPSAASANAIGKQAAIPDWPAGEQERREDAALAATFTANAMAAIRAGLEQGDLRLLAPHWQMLLAGHPQRIRAAYPRLWRTWLARFDGEALLDILPVLRPECAALLAGLPRAIPRKTLAALLGPTLRTWLVPVLPNMPALQIDGAKLDRILQDRDGAQFGHFWAGHASSGNDQLLKTWSGKDEAARQTMVRQMSARWTTAHLSVLAAALHPSCGELLEQLRQQVSRLPDGAIAAAALRLVLAQVLNARPGSIAPDRVAVLLAQQFERSQQREAWSWLIARMPLLHQAGMPAGRHVAIEAAGDKRPEGGPTVMQRAAPPAGDAGSPYRTRDEFQQDQATMIDAALAAADFSILAPHWRRLVTEAPQLIRAARPRMWKQWLERFDDEVLLDILSVVQPESSVPLAQIASTIPRRMLAALLRPAMGEWLQLGTGQLTATQVLGRVRLAATEDAEGPPKELPPRPAAAAERQSQAIRPAAGANAPLASLDPLLEKFRQWQQGDLDLSDMPAASPQLRQWLKWWLLHAAQDAGRHGELLLEAIETRCALLEEPAPFMQLVLQHLRSGGPIEFDALMQQVQHLTAAHPAKRAGAVAGSADAQRSRLALEQFVARYRRADAGLDHLDAAQLHQLLRAWIQLQHTDNGHSLLLEAIEKRALQADSIHGFFSAALQRLLTGEALDLEQLAEAGQGAPPLPDIDVAWPVTGKAAELMADTRLAGWLWQWLAVQLDEPEPATFLRSLERRYEGRGGLPPFRALLLTTLRAQLPPALREELEAITLRNFGMDAGVWAELEQLTLHPASDAALKGQLQTRLAAASWYALQAGSIVAPGPIMPAAPQALPELVRQRLSERLAQAMLRGDLSPLLQSWPQLVLHQPELLAQAARHYLHRAEPRERLVAGADMTMLQDLLEVLSPAGARLVAAVLRQRKQCNAVLPAPLALDSFQRRVLGASLAYLVSGTAGNRAMDLMPVLLQSLLPAPMRRDGGADVLALLHAWHESLRCETEAHSALGEILYGQPWQALVSESEAEAETVRDHQPRAAADAAMQALRALAANAWCEEYPQLAGQALLSGGLRSGSTQLAAGEWRAVMRAWLDRQEPVTRIGYWEAWLAAHPPHGFQAELGSVYAAASGALPIAPDPSLRQPASSPSRAPLAAVRELSPSHLAPLRHSHEPLLPAPASSLPQESLAPAQAVTSSSRISLPPAPALPSQRPGASAMPAPGTHLSPVRHRAAMEDAVAVLLMRQAELGEDEQRCLALLLQRLCAGDNPSPLPALRSALAHPDAIVRLTGMLPTVALARLFAVLQPGLAAQLPALLRALTAVRQLPVPLAPVPALLKPEIWRAIYRAVFVDWTPATFDGLVRSVVLRLAEHYEPAAAAHWQAVAAQDAGAPNAGNDPSVANAMAGLMQAWRQGDPAPARAKSAYPVRSPFAAPPAEHVPGIESNIANAGMVILAPYMRMLFERVELVQAGKFVSEDARQRAVHLLQYAVNGEQATPEYQLMLNKLLCGIPGAVPLVDGIVLNELERTSIEQMLKAVIAHWSALGNTSVSGLRETFLQREGELYFEEDAWRLKIRSGTFDMLLDRLPWSFAMIKMPWMPALLNVSWR